MKIKSITIVLEAQNGEKPTSPERILEYGTIGQFKMWTGRDRVGDDRSGLFSGETRLAAALDKVRNEIGSI